MCRVQRQNELKHYASRPPLVQVSKIARCAKPSDSAAHLSPQLQCHGLAESWLSCTACAYNANLRPPLRSWCQGRAYDPIGISSADPTYPQLMSPQLRRKHVRLSRCRQTSSSSPETLARSPRLQPSPQRHRPPDLLGTPHGHHLQTNSNGK